MDEAWSKLSGWGDTESQRRASHVFSHLRMSVLTLQVYFFSFGAFIDIRNLVRDLLGKAFMTQHKTQGTEWDQWVWGRHEEYRKGYLRFLQVPTSNMRHAQSLGDAYSFLLKLRNWASRVCISLYILTFHCPMGTSQLSPKHSITFPVPNSKMYQDLPQKPNMFRFIIAVAYFLVPSPILCFCNKYHDQK